LPKDYRIYVFVDFWNYTLSMRQKDEDFKTDLKALPKILTREAGNLVDPGALAIYSGMSVYGSYNKSTEKSLYNWATNILDTFPGVNAHFQPRMRKKSFPTCPKCHEKIENCPKCANDMRGTEEKSIDTKIVTDMISLAWEDAYDVAVLVSSDQDFVPAAEHLQKKGKKVVHAGFRPDGALLRQKCWASIDIPPLREEFRLQPR